MSPPWRAMAMSVGVMLLAGCEEHRQPAIQHAPEYLHEALAGDVGAQAALASCLEEKQGCVGSAQDAAMACAWRGVRLASQSPDLSLADDDAFVTTCMGGDRTSRQRASIAQEDFTLRIYRRHAPVSMMEPDDGPERLYPSIDIVRGRVNLALGRRQLPLLPRFGAPKPVQTDPTRITWSSCAGGVCLEGVAPAFGGGLLGYRIAVTASPASIQKDALAIQLVGDGLEAPGIAENLQNAPASAGSRRMAAGGVCWTSGPSPTGAVVAAVTAGRC